MKILIFSVLFPNKIQNTYGMFVHERVRFLKKNCQVKVVAPIPYFPRIPFFKKWSKYSLIPRYEIIDGVEVYHPRFLLFPRNLFRKYIGMIMYICTRSVVKRLKKDFNFGLIHAHFAVPTGIAASYLSKNLNIPFIITEHFSKLHEDLTPNSSIKKKLITAYNRSSLIIAVSKKVEHDLLKAGIGKEKIIIISNGVDCTRFPFVKPNENMDPIMLLSIGGLIERKGFAFLIKAVKILKNEKLNVILKIIGEGKNRKQLENLITTLDLNDNVCLEGNILHSDLKHYFKSTHIFVLPSLFESFSVVTIEALSCGIPVVVTKCGGPENFVNQSVGRIVIKGDEENLVSGIKDVIDNYDSFDRNQIRQYCYNKFDYHKIAEEINEIYINILGLTNE